MQSTSLPNIGLRFLFTFVLVAPSLVLASARVPTSTHKNTLPLNQQSHLAALQDTLETMERQSWVAWKARDGKYFDHFLSTDHVEVGFNGPSSKTDVVKFVGSPVCVVSTYKVDGFKLTILTEGSAVLTYHAEQQTKCNGAMVTSPVWVTSTFALRDHRWQNVIYQQSPDLRKSPK
ncbi:MAG: nuclear transport factor 2 family protein [Gemmatimonadaceae bacterium]